MPTSLSFTKYVTLALESPMSYGLRWMYKNEIYITVPFSNTGSVQIQLLLWDMKHGDKRNVTVSLSCFVLFYFQRSWIACRLYCNLAVRFTSEII
jgi:amino acid permease